jgi:hypothetical protein
MLFLVGMGLAMLVAALWLGRRRPFAGVAASIAILWLGLSLLIAPAIDGIRSGHSLMHTVDITLGAEQELGIVGWPEQFLLQAERPVHHFGFRRDVREDVADAIAWLRQDASRRVLISSEDDAPCFGDTGRVEVGRAHRRTWWLVGEESVLPQCRSLDASGEVIRYVPSGRP